MFCLLATQSSNSSVPHRNTMYFSKLEKKRAYTLCFCKTILLKKSSYLWNYKSKYRSHEVKCIFLQTETSANYTTVQLFWKHFWKEEGSNRLNQRTKSIGVDRCRQQSHIQLAHISTKEIIMHKKKLIEVNELQLIISKWKKNVIISCYVVMWYHLFYFWWYLFLILMMYSLWKQDPNIYKTNMMLPTDLHKFHCPLQQKTDKYN